jgi:hypothetical protein
MDAGQRVELWALRRILWPIRIEGKPVRACTIEQMESAR